MGTGIHEGPVLFPETVWPGIIHDRHWNEAGNTATQAFLFMKPAGANLSGSAPVGVIIMNGMTEGGLTLDFLNHHAGGNGGMVDGYLVILEGAGYFHILFLPDGDGVHQLMGGSVP